MRRALALVLPFVAASAFAQEDGFVAQLEQRVLREGGRQVNAYLGSHWAAAMVPLYQRTASCELGAVNLTMTLNRSADRKTGPALSDAVRLATGVCPSIVLSEMTADEVPKYCRSIASWGAMQTVRELRRRIALIESDENLRNTERAQACHAAYWYELRNSRVGLRAVPPSRPAAPKPAASAP